MCAGHPIVQEEYTENPPAYDIVWRWYNDIMWWTGKPQTPTNPYNHIFSPQQQMAHHKHGQWGAGVSWGVTACKNPTSQAGGSC